MIEFGILLVYLCNYVVPINNYVCYFPIYLPLDVMHHVLESKEVNIMLRGEDFAL